MALSCTRIGTFLTQDAARRKESQIQRYIRLGAVPEILRLIELGGGVAMGATCERLLRWEWPTLKTREPGQSGYDHRAQCPVSEEWKCLEQKTSGLWSDDPTSYRWQHIEPEHEWNGLLLVGIAPDTVKVWGMTRDAFKTCIDAGLATRQGNAAEQSYQGYWMTAGDVQEHLRPITDENDLQAFISTL
jgi:hypothetical protein